MDSSKKTTLENILFCPRCDSARLVKNSVIYNATRILSVNSARGNLFGIKQTD